MSFRQHVPRLAPSIESLPEDWLIDEQPLNVAIAHDGSIAARACIAFSTDWLLKKKQNCNVDVVHIFDISKQDTCPRSYKRDTIEAELAPLDSGKGSRFKLNLLERNPKEKEGKTIVKWTEDIDNASTGAGKTIDFLFMGFKGRRKATEEELLASDVSYATAYSRCSCIIMREEMTMPTGGMHYVVPVDLNRWSEKALFDALFLSTPEDKISVIHIKNREEETNETEDYYQKIFTRLKDKMKKPPTMEYHTIRHGGEGCAQDIIKFANDKDCDVICMGTNVNRLREKSSYLGSVCGAVLLGTKIPVVVAHYDEAFASVVTQESRPNIFLPDDDAPIFKK